MTALAVAIVVLGIAISSGLAVAAGLDVTGAVILLLIFAVGALAIAAVRKRDSGLVEPVECESCRGVISPSAPYCKHCGAERTAPSI